MAFDSPLYPPRKWQGWGDPDRHSEMPEDGIAWRFLADKINLQEIKPRPVPPLEALNIPDGRLEPNSRADLGKIVGEEFVATDAEERITHGLGKSYRDLIRLREGTVPPLPDAVVFPGNQDEVKQLLDWASTEGVQIVPFGGGSSVVGGVEVKPRFSGDRAVSLDLCRMNRLLEFDDVSLLARAEGGIYGPALEDALAQYGATLGHFPQSFEYSTLGGWVATRGAGQQSARYGKIEDMVRGLTLVAPNGIYEAPVFPASASGPSFLQYAVGSEGAFGVITDATVKVRRLPEQRKVVGYFMPDWQSSQDALRELIQQDIVPALLRVSDPQETQAYLNLGAAKMSAMKYLLRETALTGAQLLGAKVQGGCLLLVGFEGTKGEVAADYKATNKVLRAHGGFPLGASPGKSWAKERYSMPYTRDLLMDRGVLTDTLETATRWSNLNRLYEAVREAIATSMVSTKSIPLVMCHISHVYRDGASLYFTFMGAMNDQPEAQWLAVKEAATNAISENGGTVSHHHAVGYEHKPWMQKEYGRILQVYRDTKRELDPENILNPGKLF